MLQKLGWNLGKPVDRTFAEHIEIRKLNRQVIDDGHLDLDAARRCLSALPMPWAVKDPRFVQTLQHWLPLFVEAETKPVLLRLRRDLSATKYSYNHRRAPGDVEHRIEQLAQQRDQMYDLWPWARFTLEYEKIAAAVAAFDTERFEATQQKLALLASAAATKRMAAATEAEAIANETGSSRRRDSMPAVDLQQSLNPSRQANVELHSERPQNGSLSVSLDSSLPSYQLPLGKLALKLDSSIVLETTDNLFSQTEDARGEFLEREILKNLYQRRPQAETEEEDGSR
jgi:hypothetical protein